MKYFFTNLAFVLACCFNYNSVEAEPVLQSWIAFDVIRCAPLQHKDGRWNDAIDALLNAPDIQKKPYLVVVSNVLDKINHDQVDSKDLYNASLEIEMSVCSFPTKYHAVLRGVINNLILRAAMGGEKDAVYGLRDTFPTQQELNYIYGENIPLSVDYFTKIREGLEEEESHIDDAENSQQLKDILKRVISKAKSAPNSPVPSPIKSERLRHSDSDIYE